MNKPKDKKDPKDEFYVLAVLLAEVVKRILKKKAGLEFSKKPLFALKPIVEFRKKMRISGLEKFNAKTYIASINFYLSDEALEKHQAIGALIIYIPEDHVSKFVQQMRYPSIDEDDEEALEDACGTLCNLIGGNFKSGLTQLGYMELVMSHFSTFVNEAVNGIEYDPKQKEIYEISFEIEREKLLVADLTMGHIPKWK